MPDETAGPQEWSLGMGTPGAEAANANQVRARIAGASDAAVMEWYGAASELHRAGELCITGNHSRRLAELEVNARPVSAADITAALEAAGVTLEDDEPDRAAAELARRRGPSAPLSHTPTATGR